MLSQILRIFFSVVVGLLLSSEALARGEPDGPGPGGPPMSDEQRKCMEGRLGKPGSGSRPSQEVMESVFKECGLSKPRSQVKSETSRGAVVTLDDTEQTEGASVTKKHKELLALLGLKIVRNEAESLGVEGQIPQLCAGKVALRMECVSEEKVNFTLQELSSDGFSCLKENQKKCATEAEVRNECLSLANLSQNPKSKSLFQVMLNSSSASQAGKDCAKVKIASAKVAILKRSLDSDESKTEAGVCIQCDAQKSQIEKLQAQVRLLQQTVEKSVEAESRMSRQPPGGRHGSASGEDPSDQSFRPRTQSSNAPRGGMGGAGGGSASQMLGMFSGAMMGMGGMSAGGMGQYSMNPYASMGSYGQSSYSMMSPYATMPSYSTMPPYSAMSSYAMASSSYVPSQYTMNPYASMASARSLNPYSGINSYSSITSYTGLNPYSTLNPYSSSYTGSGVSLYAPSYLTNSMYRYGSSR